MTTEFVHDPSKDIALVKNGTVAQVSRAPCDPADFGPEPDGDLVDLDPGAAVSGMLWDGAALSLPPPSPPPPAPRLKLAKSLLVQRVTDTGKIAAVFTWLMGQPALFARWTAPDKPEVFADDADLHAALAAGGLTSSEIAAVTAA